MMRAGRLPEDHPLERAARAQLRNQTKADTPAGKVEQTVERIRREQPPVQPARRKRW